MGTLFYTFWLLLSVWAVIHLLLFKREPSSTIAWLLFVITLPIAGALLFLVFGPQRLERQAFKRKQEIKKMLSRSWFDLPGDGNEQEDASRVLANDTHVLQLARQISEYGVTSGNAVDLLHDPYHALLAMQEAIENAKHFIHLEYYIIASDEVTKQLFDYLLKAAERGVEIRILYDALGSIFLKRIFFRRLLQQGVKIAGFLPFSFIPQRMNVNFRNHRKILVVDGLTGFTGGTNIGRQYLGRKNEGQWHDYSVRVIGPVCQQLQDVFARDWQFTTQEDLFHERYYPKPEKAGDSVIQVLDSGPDAPFYSLHQALFLAINSAEHEILLTTPYFVPDPAITTSIIVAALRGIKVKILLPLKSDSRLVQHASRSFFDDLLRAGVCIYEYQPRVLHAKMLIIDKKWTILGSANMDIRSFRLNFELNLLIYGPSMAEQANLLFQADLKQSKKVELDAFMARSLGQKVIENACRLLSPVL